MMRGSRRSTGRESRPPADPEAEARTRLTFLLSLLRDDPSRLPARAWRLAEEFLVFSAGSSARWPRGARRRRHAAARALATLREHLTALVRGTPQAVAVLDGTIHLRPVRLGRRLMWQTRHEPGRLDLAAALLLRVAEDLRVIGEDRLRQCACIAPGPGPDPTPEHDTRCPVLFLAVRGQRHCSAEHRARASYLSWVRRGMPRRTRGGSRPDPPPEAVAERAAKALAEFRRKHGRTPGELAVERQIAQEGKGISERGRRQGGRRKGAT